MGVTEAMRLYTSILAAAIRERGDLAAAIREKGYVSRPRLIEGTYQEGLAMLVKEMSIKSYAPNFSNGMGGRNNGYFLGSKKSHRGRTQRRMHSSK